MGSRFPGILLSLVVESGSFAVIGIKEVFASVFVSGSKSLGAAAVFICLSNSFEPAAGQ